MRGIKRREKDGKEFFTHTRQCTRRVRCKSIGKKGSKKRAKGQEKGNKRTSLTTVKQRRELKGL
jgi:hypothetical protein